MKNINDFTHFKSAKTQEDFFNFYEEEQKKITVPIKTGYTETSCGSTFYIESGSENKETILFIHGNAENSITAKPIHEEYCSKYRVISVDSMWQIGRSFIKKPINKIDRFNDWISEVLDFFQIDKVILLGFSYGSWIATDYAILNPDRVKSLILISPAASFDSVSFSYFFYLYKLAIFPNRKNIKRFLQLCYGKGNIVPTFAMKQIEMQFKNCKLTPPEVAPRVFQDNELKQISMPTLLLMGSKEKVTNPIKSLNRAKSLINNIKTKSIDGGGHYLDVTHTKEMLIGISDFLGFTKSNECLAPSQGVQHS